MSPRQPVARRVLDDLRREMGAELRVQRVAADGKIHPGELRAITLIRSIMSMLSQTDRPQHRCREASASGAPVNGFNIRTRR